MRATSLMSIILFVSLTSCSQNTTADTIFHRPLKDYGLDEAFPSLLPSNTIPKPNCKILSMNPTSYWPANEGAGNVLHDLSHHGNHGRINHHIL